MHDHPLDWKRPGLSPFMRKVCGAFLEAMLADTDAEGALIPAPASTVERTLASFDLSLGVGSDDVRRGFFVLCVLMELLPLAILGRASRASRLSLPERVAYLDALERHRVGLVTVLVVAFKVPLGVPAFEDGDELALTGFDRDSTASRRRLPVAVAHGSDEEGSP